MNTYLCNDGNAEVEIEAETAQEAAQEYVDGGEWGDIEETSWVKVRVTGPMPDAPELDDQIVQFSSCDDDEPQGEMLAEYCTLEQALGARICESCYVAHDDTEDAAVLLIGGVPHEYWTFCTDDASTHDEEPDSEWIRITLEPNEPECEEGEDHDWQSPIEIVGGIAENPGVWGHGGGVIITVICMHCGTERVTDTWAQDMSDGVQGLKSTSYVANKYADEVAALREDED